MKGQRKNPRDSFSPALEAIGNLLQKELNEIFLGGEMAAISAHAEIESALINQKSGAFYRHFLPLRANLVSVLARSYRRLFRLALAHPHEVGRNSHEWARIQLQPAIGAALEWIRNWYIRACDVRPLASTEWVPGETVSLSVPTTVAPLPPWKSWRAPAWLFAISLAYVGVGPLKDKHVPATDSEEKLSAAHTRLLLKGARRMFLWELGAAVETARNEEIAAAGAIPTQAGAEEKRGPNKRKGWEQRLKLYSAIQKALSDNSRLQGMEFCAELDKRHAPPLYDWTRRGEWRNGLTWKEAWNDPGLRRKIRRVRQEAMKDR